MMFKKFESIYLLKLIFNFDYKISYLNVFKYSYFIIFGINIKIC